MIENSSYTRGLNQAQGLMQSDLHNPRAIPGQRTHEGCWSSTTRKKITGYLVSRPLVYICNKTLSIYLKIALCRQGGIDSSEKLLSSEETEKVNMFLSELHARASELIQKLDLNDVRQEVKQSFIDLDLMDLRGEWTQEIFEIISNNLSDDISQETIEREISEVFKNIKSNDYLMHAIHNIINVSETTEGMLEKGKNEIIHELESVLPFALALNLLTKAQIQNTEVLEVCVHLWKKKRNEMRRANRGLGFKKVIKLISVEQPIVKMLKSRTKRDYPHSQGRCVLPFNIIEATAFETVRGRHENACAGLTLAQHYPGKYTQRASELDEQGQQPLFNYPMPKQWSDLYTTWNMNFCVNSKERPEMLSKLLMPAVSSYQDKPRTYISCRSYALYTALNYLFFRAEKSNPVPRLSTVAKQAWGHSNRVCSRLYQREVTSEAAVWENGMAPTA
ncbi:hypothetical protein [Endozoicomonas sp. GU-1]|uniref:hypothetical protein n=1 Tax=Endozoicomonas sp. GU-1 TaxID=3009078 RepID=UPI0022B34837|nr:hypothetical protein [Endozoicomonas sp. GU-1]WBA82694.1 hypothetical protein O2T12_06035 [Endozoicomonas sp. GU-1]WBA85625.1 hypothetical protein O3276_20685 [Endozoicomonas sp. GU-1]